MSLIIKRPPSQIYIPQPRAKKRKLKPDKDTIHLLEQHQKDGEDLESTNARTVRIAAAFLTLTF